MNWVEQYGQVLADILNELDAIFVCVAPERELAHNEEFLGVARDSVCKLYVLNQRLKMAAAQEGARYYIKQMYAVVTELLEIELEAQFPELIERRRDFYAAYSRPGIRSGWKVVWVDNGPKTWLGKFLYHVKWSYFYV